MPKYNILDFNWSTVHAGVLYGWCIHCDGHVVLSVRHSETVIAAQHRALEIPINHLASCALDVAAERAQRKAHADKALKTFRP